MRPATRLTLLAVSLLAIGAHPASAQVYGSLANFDAVNDTGDVAHGFEIDIEDPLFDHTKIQSIFGLDRNFGVPPASVERYGAPVVTDVAGFGTTIRYAGTFNGSTWNVGTPTGPYPNAGDSCWPLGNAAYAGGGLTCDHFGVGTYTNPAKTTYHWLVDPTNSGALTPKAAALPPVNFIYQAPAPGQPPAPQPLVAEIDAHKENNEIFGTAYWVKTFAHHLDHNVHLDELLKGNAVVPKDNEVEAEFELLQAGDVGGNGKKQANLLLDPADKALVLRYEFYKYQGSFTAEGEADCGGHGGGDTPADCGGLGAFVGAQIAGFNQIQPLGPVVAAIPEPGTYAMLLAGLGGIGLAALRRKR